MSKQKKIFVSPLLTSSSTEEEIITAIQKAGCHRYLWRTYDWPEPTDQNKKSWVIPRDISNGSNMVKKMHTMVGKGILEVWYTTKSINIHPPIFQPRYSEVNSMPRFRVILKP